MNRTSRTLLSVGLVLVGFSSWGIYPTPAAAQAKKKPNIIFLLTDDQRYDVLGCAGHPIVKTPHVDALAKKGVRFKNAFVTTSICAASRASLLTGLYERTHLYTFGTPPIEPHHVAISYPLLLRQAGYRTGFVGKFGVTVAKGDTHKMFDVFVPLNRTPYFKKQPDGTKRHVDDIAGDHAVEFLRGCKKEQPFCLSVSFNSPHGEDNDHKDYYPWPPSANGLYENQKMPPPKLSDPAIFESQPEFLKKSMNRIRYFWAWDTSEKYQKNMKAYFRMISGVDAIVGRVLAELKTLGLDDDTLIIFASDNGYYLANRGFAGKWSHYEDSLRVPMIIYDPRLPPAQRGHICADMALNVDLPATMLDYAGLKIPALYQGKSLLPLLRDDKPKDWRTDFFCEHLMAHKDIPRWEGVRGQRWVYARYFEQKPVFEFLHDLQTDPDQLKNLAKDPAHVQQLQVMSKRCDELRNKYGGPFVPRKKVEKK